MEIMHKMILLSLMTLILSLTLFSCSKDENMAKPVPPEVFTAADLTAALEEVVSTTEVPGFALTLVKNNAILYQKAFGYADQENGRLYTNQTIQPIASTSKTFVAAAVVKAIEQGHFTMETKINDLLPVEVRNPKQPEAEIKVKHLVTHTSGLLDNQALYLSENYYILPGEDLSTPGAETLQAIGIEQRTGRTLEEFLAEYYLEDGDLYSLDNFAATLPGTTWAYSNVATGLTGYLIEAATGQSFADYVRTNILLPLGMQSSSYQVAEVEQGEMAKWYLDQNTPFPLYANDSYPEGSLFTSNADLGKYLLDMVKGVQGSGQLLEQSGYDLLFGAQLQPGIVPAEFAEDQGIFWYMNEGKIQHSGNSFGVSTYLEIDPADHSGYLLLTNMDASFSNNYNRYQRVAKAIDQAVGQFLGAN